MSEMIGNQGVFQKPKEVWREICVCIILHNPHPGMVNIGGPLLLSIEKARNDIDSLGADRRKMENLRPGVRVEVC